MRIIDRPLGMVQANCYLIVSEQNHAAIVDPGGDAAVIKSWVEKEGVVPQLILLTHGHFDHIAGLWDLATLFDVPVYIHQEDAEMLTDIEKSLCGLVPLYFNYYDHLPFTELQDGSVLSLDELSIRFLHTPGHTKGSGCFLVEDAIITGDTLFADSIGRTDLDGGDIRELEDSLRKIIALDKNYRVFPGHGASTMLQREKMSNPYLVSIQ